MHSPNVRSLLRSATHQLRARSNRPFGHTSSGWRMVSISPLQFIRPTLLTFLSGWIPTDPRTAVGTCATLGYDNNQPFNGSYESWQTGGFGAGTIAATALASYSQYPPPAISNAGGANPLSLPQYTATSAVPSLAVPTFSGATASAGDGWADPSDTAMAAVQISGCIYPNAWGAPASSTAFLCGAAAQAVTATPAP